MTADTPARTPSDAVGQTDPRDCPRCGRTEGYGCTCEDWQLVEHWEGEAAALREKLEAAGAEAQRRYFEGWQHGLTTARAEGAANWLAAKNSARSVAFYQCGCASSIDTLTPPADLTAALDEVRRQERAKALEEAAKVADYYAEMDYCAMNYPEDGGIAASGTADTIRRDIRALKTGDPE